MDVKPMRRNTRACTGRGRCAIGCAKKRSVNLTYLPKARAHGAVIYSDCRVERIVIDGGRAVGVRGRVLGGRRGKPQAPFAVHAKAVVVAAGALHTPLLLRASGLRSRAIGRNLSLHPGFAVGALSKTRLDGWRGAMQSAYTDHLAPEGILMLSMFADPSMIASRMPGVGRAHMSYARRVPNTALFAGLVRDSGRGVVRRGFGREPIITYRMTPHDKANFVRAFCTVGEMALAGGAEEVMLPIRGLGPIRSVSELREVAARPPRASRFHAISFHPLCTARMGRSPAHDVVAENGETYEVANLFVADGSAFRSPPGVNAQVPIMASATRIAWAIRDGWSRRVRGIA
jgi:choline dehydrogenase-like flavoprotein